MDLPAPTVCSVFFAHFLLKAPLTWGLLLCFQRTVHLPWVITQAPQNTTCLTPVIISWPLGNLRVRCCGLRQPERTQHLQNDVQLRWDDKLSNFSNGFSHSQLSIAVCSDWKHVGISLPLHPSRRRAAVSSGTPVDGWRDRRRPQKGERLKIAKTEGQLRISITNEDWEVYSCIQTEAVWKPYFTWTNHSEQEDNIALSWHRTVLEAPPALYVITAELNWWFLIIFGGPAFGI